jgi:hypothetical protein
VTWSFSEGLSSNTRGTGASEKGSSEFFGRRNRHGSSLEEGGWSLTGQKPSEWPAIRPVAALKLAQLGLNGETCGKRPARPAPGQAAQSFFHFA